MEHDITKFCHFMRRKGFIEPFSLYRNQLVALVVQGSLDECLYRLAALDKDAGLRSRAEYTLKTDVLSLIQGEPIRCTFFFRHRLKDGFSIYRMEVVPPGGLRQQVRRVLHNMEIPGASLAGHLFPELKQTAHGLSCFKKRSSL